jgi:hypothetical protein
VITTLDRLLPDYDQHEVHSRWINAGTAAVWTALHETTAADLPLTRVLMRARSAGRTRLQGPVLKSRPAVRPLAETHGSEVVGGVITKAWRLRPKIMDLSGGPEAFVAFNQPGWGKVGIDYQLIAENGGIRLRTETRCKATGGQARAAFWLYWSLIRWGSGLIRREILATIARRAERISGP